jgi:hypothetical protein
MSVSVGPKITTNGLILALDAADLDSLLSKVEVLVVAGGGGGGVGGGGAGGLIYNSEFPVSPGTAYSITVGAGGAASTFWGGNGSSGANSTFSSLTAIGGGAGNHASASPSGGSGGGGGYLSAGGAGTTGQGFAGGYGLGAPNYPGGGGGGAGAPGANAISTSIAGAGGSGLQYSISGTLTYYAGGGGGSTQGGGTGATGGLGGGGAGGGNVNGTAGTSNTGGGGGGGTNLGGAGGSGIVIVRYYGPQKASGGTITSVGGYTIHTFTSVGSSSFTPNATWYDLSGYGNHGTINSGEFSTANNGYLQNSGNVTNFFYISIPDSTSISAAFSPAGGGWTIEETVYTYSVTYPEADAGTVVSGQAYSAGYIGFDWNHGIGNTQFVFGQSNNSASGYSDQPTISLNAPYSNLNYWKLRSMVWDRSANTVSLYINGVYQGVGSTPNTAGKTIYDGGGISLGTLYGWKHFGRRSLVRVYNRILTATEINQNYQAIKTRYDI